MTVKGIDVASYQTSTFSTSGLAFLMVKATESTTYVNPKHDAQVAHGRANGLIIGHYHFVRAGSMSAQANYFLTHAKAKPGDMLSLDWEDSAVSSASKDAWLAYVMAKQPGHQTLLYCNLNFWLNRDSSGKYGNGLWIADPSAPAGKPRIKTPYTIHQYGITGGLDVDLGNFATKAALKTWADKAPVVVPPVNPPKPAPTPEPSVTVTQAQMVSFLYNNLGKIDSLDKNPDGSAEGRHAAGFFLAHARHDALVATQQLAALTVQVQEIHDKLFAPDPVPAQPQTEHAAALTQED
jgi:Glycosyl hydrolases family 25